MSRIARFVSALVLLCVSPLLVRAQSVAWTQKVVSGPSARLGHAMVYDSARGVVVLFGGYLNGVRNGQTWEWDGAHWQQRVVTGPSARVHHAMAYDSARGVTVLFGGATVNGTGSETFSSETWEWNGTVWSQRMVSGASGLVGHAMAYDSVRGVTVLFGGYEPSPNIYSNSTWEWDGTAWTHRVVTGPSGRSGHAMSFDSLNGVTVLSGGYIGPFPNPVSDQTWEWNGTQWTLREVGDPSPRQQHALAYDAARGITFLFGGTVTGTSAYSETWAWSREVQTWTQLQMAGPPQRYSAAMAYDAARRVTLLFGGTNGNATLGDTWVLGGSCGSSDFDHDGDSGTDADIEAFFACISGNCCATCGSADFNGDGNTATDADIEAFFRVLAGGSC